MIPILFFMAAAIFLIKHHFDCNEALAACNAHCNASDAFTEWRLKNPGVYIGLSVEGRQLLAELLRSYDWFMRTHKFIKENGRREYLVSLFYDLPPKHPDHKDPIIPGVVTNALFFYMGSSVPVC